MVDVGEPIAGYICERQGDIRALQEDIPGAKLDGVKNASKLLVDEYT